ncbi:uncharacterized protein [Antedon mediterranea]|uniref:uncharacterized protein n=1 Tax=Antedon mediterranea TaxID=105859 RepID=UPI003AF4374F
MNNSIYLDKTSLHKTEDYSRNYLPKLVTEATFQHTSGDNSRMRLSKSEEANRSGGLESAKRQRSLSTGLISLPHLVSYRELMASQSNSTQSYLSTRDVKTSDQSDDEYDDDMHSISIDPYPNVSVESFLNSNHFPEAPPTPPRRRKRKEIKLKVKKEAEAAKKGQKREQVRKARRWSQSERLRERELARRHPVRKQFLYSELMEEELKSHIPKRIPGGKLKPIYKRTTEGEIFVPNYPLHINLDRLNVRENEGIPLTDSATDINKFRKQEIREMLEKRKKLQLQRLKKRKKRVRFNLPSCHVDSEDSDFEQSNLTSRECTSMCSQNTVDAHEDDFTVDITAEKNDQNIEEVPLPLSLSLVNDSSEQVPAIQNHAMNDIPKNSLKFENFPILHSSKKESSHEAEETTSPGERDCSADACLKLPEIKSVDMTEDDTVTIVDSYQFRISKTNGNAIKYTRIDPQ